MNINRVILIGNLTRDPELRTTPSGTSVCNMRIAVNTRRKDGEEWVEKPNYFDVTVWGKQGENCAQYLAKGRPCGIDGRLEWREWETDDGGKRQAVEIVAESVQFLGSRDGESAAPSNDPAASDDDIPFQVAVDYPTGTEILCPECRRVLLRLNRDLWAGDILHSVDVDQVDAPEHGVGAAVACPEHGILDRYTTIARRPDGTEKVGI